MRALLVVLLILPLGQAFVATDPADDVQFETWTGTGWQYTDAPPGYEHVDILEIVVDDETAEDFRAAVTFATNPQVESPLPLGERQLFFTHDGAQYRVLFEACDGAPSLGLLNTGSGRFDTIECLDGGKDGTTFWAQVPKGLIPTSTGVPAAFGSLLTDFTASYSEFVAFTPAGVGTTNAIDRAPDEGAYADVFQFKLGAGGLGDVQVVAQNAIRASNGGPDTFVYSIHLRNAGEEVRFGLTAADVPTNWDVRVPPTVRVPAGEDVIVPVAVTTRAAHAHGGSESFFIEVADAEDPAKRLRVELGIHYLDIPQLAGHHPELFVHGATAPANVAGTQGETTVAWMNTAPDAPGAEAVTIPARGGGTGGTNAAGTMAYSGWQVPMDPQLLIGMDFDVDATGELTVAFQADNRVPGDVTLAAVLWHCDPENASAAPQAPSETCAGGGWHELARGVAAPYAMPSVGAFEIDVTLTPHPYADLVPYVDGSNVLLQLVIGRDAPAPRGYPELDPRGTSLRLPLNEYRDPLDAVFEDIAALRITPRSEFEKAANPGQSVWFRFDVEGDMDMPIVASVFGHNDAWASVASASPDVAPDTPGEVVVRVDAPSTAAVGEFTELFVVVEDAEEPARAAISKMRVSIVAADVPAEEPPEVAQDVKKSPAPLALVVVALAVLARRR